MKALLRFIWFLSVGFALVQTPAMAYDWPHIQTRKIAPNTYILEHGPHDEPRTVSHGFHNNPGFVVTNSGVVVIDTGSSYEIGKMILRRIRAITDKPITHIFTTHFHGDHWLANQALVEAYPKAKTLAHPRLIALLNSGEDRFWMETFAKRLGDYFAGTQAVIPNTPAEARRYTIGGVNFSLMLFDKAHTATDLMVYVEEEGVLFTGDVVNNDHLSFMGHGNFKAAYEATQRALATKARHIVVGHGNSGKMELVQHFGEFYHSLIASVSHYYEEGLMDYEMKPKVVADLKRFSHWHGFDAQIGRYISQLVQELEAETFQ